MTKTDLVRAGYDRIAGRYADQRGGEASLRFLEMLNARLDAGSRILDLGCGAGVPVDRYLVDHGHDVTGMDVSEAMLALARRNVPEASYRAGDMTELREADFAVDAVVSFFAVIHVDRRRHEDLFRTIRSFLPRGGPILVTMGDVDWEGEEDFLGVPMAWSHFGRETNRELIEDCGFAIEFEGLHPGDFPGDGDGHPILLAHRT